MTVDTEAAEVWRRLSACERSVLRNGAMRTAQGYSSWSYGAKAVERASLRMIKIGALGADRKPTDLGKRVAAYGRLLSESTGGGR